MTKRVNSVEADDWEAIYIDGALWSQQHSHPLVDVLEAAGVKVSTDYYESVEDDEECKIYVEGRFPDTYAEFEKDWRHDPYNQHYGE